MTSQLPIPPGLWSRFVPSLQFFLFGLIDFTDFLSEHECIRCDIALAFFPGTFKIVLSGLLCHELELESPHLRWSYTSKFLLFRREIWEHAICIN